MYEFIFRQNAKHLSFRKRYISLSSIEQVRVKRLKKIIQAVMCKIYKTEDPLMVYTLVLLTEIATVHDTAHIKSS